MLQAGTVKGLMVLSIVTANNIRSAAQEEEEAADFFSIRDSYKDPHDGRGFLRVLAK